MAANAKKKPQAAPAKAAEKPKRAGMDLSNIGDLSGLLSTPTAATVGEGLPLDLALDLIDEDPNQPRKAENPGFSAESLGELADTIRLRGVKTPISVRENLEQAGRYIINHGARRYRGSRLAGKATIPAFIDNNYNEADQVIENLHRNDLTSREIADYIGRGLAAGKKKGDIAKELGKSAPFVTQHVTLLDLPEPIAQAFNTGRARDVTVVNELVTAHKKNPKEVGTWLADESQEITRGSVKLLRDFLEEKRSKTGDGEGENENQGEGGGEGGETEPAKPKAKREADPEKIKGAIVQVRHDGRSARLVLTKRPSQEGSAWLKYEDDGHEFETELAGVELVGLIEG